jgi:hypothetical protein
MFYYPFRLSDGEAAIFSSDVIRWDEKAGLRRDAIGSQVIDALEGARDKGDRQ